MRLSQEIQTTHDGSADALVSAIAHGDQRAFERLYDLLAPAVFGMVRTVLLTHPQSEELAEDITTDVFVELWRTAARPGPDQTGAVTRVMSMAHRRAGDGSDARRTTATRRVGTGP